MPEVFIEYLVQWVSCVNVQKTSMNCFFLFFPRFKYESLTSKSRNRIISGLEHCIKKTLEHIFLLLFCRKSPTYDTSMDSTFKSDLQYGAGLFLSRANGNRHCSCVHTWRRPTFPLELTPEKGFTKPWRSLWSRRGKRRLDQMFCSTRTSRRCLPRVFSYRAPAWRMPLKRSSCFSRCAKLPPTPRLKWSFITRSSGSLTSMPPWWGPPSSAPSGRLAKLISFIVKFYQLEFTFIGERNSVFGIRYFWQGSLDVKFKKIKFKNLG